MTAISEIQWLILIWPGPTVNCFKWSTISWNYLYIAWQASKSTAGRSSSPYWPTNWRPNAISSCQLFESSPLGIMFEIAIYWTYTDLNACAVQRAPTCLSLCIASVHQLVARRHTRLDAVIRRHAHIRSTGTSSSSRALQDEEAEVEIRPMGVRLHENGTNFRCKFLSKSQSGHWYPIDGCAPTII